MSKKANNKKANRFKIVTGYQGCFIVDTDNKLASMPLALDYKQLSEENKKKLKEWIQFLNKKG